MCKGVNRQTLSDHLINKQQHYTAKITTYVRSKTKDLFLEDCRRKGVRQAVLARDIIEKYYQIVRQYPHLFETEMTELKKILANRIKL